MEKAIWPIPKTTVSVVPVPVLTDCTPLEHYIFWQHNPEEYKMEQIELTNPDDHTQTEVFNILSWVSKYPLFEVEDLMARLAYQKGSYNSRVITGQRLIQSILREPKKYPDYQNAEFILFLEIEKITNDKIQDPSN